MGILTSSQKRYYSGVTKSFTGDGSTSRFTIANSENAFPSHYNARNIRIYIDNELYLLMPRVGASPTANYRFIWGNANGWHIIFDAGAPADGAVITVEVDNKFGNYQFTSLDHIINQFMFAYVGEDKIISKTKRLDVAYHAQRAMQELSFDTFKSCKAQEITLPPTLTMILPHDYVNYVKITWSDAAGIEHVLYPTSKTSNPFNIKQESDGSYSFDIDDDSTVNVGDRDDTNNLIPGAPQSTTWSNYKSTTPSENNNDDYEDDTYWPLDGKRYGLDPQHAQVNGSFYIDCVNGLIHFSSNMSGKTVILHYISDGLGTDEEMIVHKMAEEAIYKWIAYGILSTRINTPEYIINRFKKEKFAETRKAKLRLSNIKLEEITQILRGKSKQIKH
tara:strand:- start:10817 stop:11986 length:1170 start_codon:yes stop_codon:yes gene_type:complete